MAAFRRAEGSVFKDRADAGRRLGEALREYQGERPILLGLARGGLPVAASAAAVLDAEFDALVVRKVKAAGEDREFGEGAVAPGGIQVGDAPRKEVERAKAEMERRVDQYLGGHPAPTIGGRLAILVDDGLATGVTALAAVRYVRTLDPAKIIMAVPVLSEEAREAVAAEADEIVFLDMPKPFRAVGDGYAFFDEVTDGEVQTLLSSRRLDGPNTP